jgi:hypothetical protein
MGHKSFDTTMRYLVPASDAQTGLIGLSYRASRRRQIRQGSPFNRKSPPAEEPFDATIDSVAVTHQQELETATQEMFLDLSGGQSRHSSAEPGFGRRPVIRGAEALLRDSPKEIETSTVGLWGHDLGAFPMKQVASWCHSKASDYGNHLWSVRKPLVQGCASPYWLCPVGFRAD